MPKDNIRRITIIATVFLVAIAVTLLAAPVSISWKIIAFVLLVCGISELISISKYM